MTRHYFTVVLLLKHDISELLLTYEADVNIMDHGKTVEHTAAELNDTLLILLHSGSSKFGVTRCIFVQELN
jgi:hypothetical protein